MVDENGKPVDPSVLESYLKSQGYDIEIKGGETGRDEIPVVYSVAMQKTQNHPLLNLPLRLVTPEQLGAKLEYDPEASQSFGEAVSHYIGNGWHAPQNTQYLYQFAPRQAIQAEEQAKKI
jgi:hypothetical protein